MKTAAEALAQGKPEPQSKPVETGDNAPNEHAPISAEGGNPANEVSSDSSVTKPSILERAAQFKPSEVNPDPAKPEMEADSKFNYNDLDNIKTPEEAKAWAENSHKSFEKGYQQKFQDLAQQRRELEQKMSELNNWTPDRIAQVINDPKFVDAAQQYQLNHNPAGSGKTDEEWSAMSDSEKAAFASVQKELADVKQAMQMEQMSRELDKQHTDLSSKYSNYDRSKTQSIFDDIMGGKIQTNMEHIYKAFYHDENVERAYQMGLQDAGKNVQEKMNANSTVDNRISVTPNTNAQKAENETSQNFFKRIVADRLANAK